MDWMSAAVGIDLIEIAEVHESIRTFGDSYLHRVFTPAEIRESGGSARHLAARYAAKEAVMKALSCRERLPWHSIAVVDDDFGRPSVELTGAAAEAAEAAGVGAIAISFTNGGSCAGAIVLMEAR